MENKINRLNNKSALSVKQKYNLHFACNLYNPLYLYIILNTHTMLIDHYYCIEQSGLTLELESFINDGIALELYFGNGKSLTLDIYDDLTEKFSDHYATLCATLDPFIVEQLEREVARCFTK